MNALKLNRFEIVQSELTIEQARELGLIGDWPRSCWTENMAKQYPEAIIYQYDFDGITGGHVFNEVADFVTLTDFAEGVQEVFDQIWRDLMTCQEVE